MQRRLFYTSPVDHHNSESWEGLASSLKRAVVSACDSGLSVQVGTRPLFGYGTDTEEALAEIEEQHLAPREVRIDLWSSIVFYAAVCVTLGSGIRRKERRALMSRLKKKELSDQTLLREHEGPYDLESGRVYGYSLSPSDDRATIARLLEPFDGPIYLGEHWLIQDETEQVDTKSFDLVFRVGPNLAVFFASDPEAEERIWEACLSGEGLIAFYADDPAEAALKRRFSDFEDLQILLAEHPSAAMRVTIGRCHQDDSLVVVHGPPYAPELDESVLFVV